MDFDTAVIFMAAATSEICNGNDLLSSLLFPYSFPVIHDYKKNGQLSSMDILHLRNGFQGILIDKLLAFLKYPVEAKTQPIFFPDGKPQLEALFSQMPSSFFETSTKHFFSFSQGALSITFKNKVYSYNSASNSFTKLPALTGQYLSFGAKLESNQLKFGTQKDNQIYPVSFPESGFKAPTHLQSLNFLGVKCVVQVDEEFFYAEDIGDSENSRAHLFVDNKHRVWKFLDFLRCMDISYVLMDIQGRIIVSDIFPTFDEELFLHLTSDGDGGYEVWLKDLKCVLSNLKKFDLKSLYVMNRSFIFGEDYYTPVTTHWKESNSR
jgi:hypothetical protein